MKLKLTNRLGVRVTLYLLIGLTLFAAFLIAFLFYSINSRKEVELGLYEVHGKTMIKNLSGAIIFGLLSQNNEVLEHEVKKQFEDPTITYVVIYDDSSKEVLKNFKQGWNADKFEFKTPAVMLKEAGRKARMEGESEILVGHTINAQGEEFLDFLIVVRSEEGSFGIPSRDDRPLGWVRIGMSLNELNQQIRNSQSMGVLLFLALMGVGAYLIVVLQRNVIPPINRLAAAAERISRRDYEVRVEVTSEDEIGLLSETFNEMVRNIKHQTSHSESLIDNIAQAIKLLTETTTQLLGITTEQASGATEQAAIVQEVVSTTEEIANTANRIADTSSSVHKASQNASEACGRGAEFVESAMQGMEEIRDQVDKGTEQIMNLAQQAQMIGTVIEIIEEISEQTNLLALNAAIEAAGAGDAGRRFSVVAGEVRNLANRTLESTESVRKLIETIRNSTSAIVLLSENEQKAVIQGAESVQKMGEYFQHILDMVETTTQSASEIGLITQQQSTATEQMVTSIREVEGVTREVEKGVKEVEISMGDLKDLTERLKRLTEQREEETTAH